MLKRRKNPRWWRRYPVAITGVVLLLCAGAAAAQQSSDWQSGQGARCRKCHKEIVAEFPASLHGKSVKFPFADEEATCQACHGDGTAHIRSGLPKDIVYARDREVTGCMSCHGKEHRRRAWNGSPHDRSDMSCRSCHSVHHTKSEPMLRMPVIDLCLSCHREIQKALHQRSTHIFRTEQQTTKIGCDSCHDPHGGEGRKMLLASSTNNVCYTCHAEKRGPFLWEHPPVREDCSTCHIPHGSNQPNLLRTRSHMLCQGCHMFTLSRHQTIAGFDIFTFNRGCVNCHSQIHGSNHPSAKGFTN